MWPFLAKSLFKKPVKSDIIVARIAWLLASVPPPVNIISSGSALMAFASFCLAVSTIALAAFP